MSGWSGTGLLVNGSNNTVENIVINDGVIGNGDKDGMRFFGSGHTFRNIKITINTCASPAHCDGVQTFGIGSGNNTVFDGMEIHNFSIYQDGTSYMKGQCFMLEYGAHDITIKNSVLNCYRGVMLGDSRYPPTERITIVNNTFVGQIPPPVSSVLEWGVFVTSGNSTTVQRNVFYNLAGEHLLGEITAGYNWIYRTDGGRIYAPTYSTDKLATDPLLDAAYHPFANSPLCALGWGAFPCGSITITPTATYTPSRTPTTTFTSTLTSTPTKVSTFTPTPTYTPTPPLETACVKVTWGSGLNLRESASLHNFGRIGYLYRDVIFLPLSIVENDEGRFAQYGNPGYIAMWTTPSKYYPNGRVYAIFVPCP